MKYAFELGSSAMIYILSFIKIHSAFKNLTGGGDTQIHRQHGDRINLFYFFKIRKVD
jgi:hypothetical protein